MPIKFWREMFLARFCPALCEPVPAVISQTAKPWQANPSAAGLPPSQRRSTTASWRRRALRSRMRLPSRRS